MAWISIPFHDDSYVGKIAIAAGVFLVIGMGGYSLYNIMRRKNKLSAAADTRINGIKTDGLVQCIDQLNQAIGNLKHIKLDHQGNDGKNDEKSQRLIVCIDHLANQVNQLRLSLESLQTTDDTNFNRRDSFTSIASSQSSDNFYDTTLEDDDAYNSGMER